MGQGRAAHTSVTLPFVLQNAQHVVSHATSELAVPRRGLSYPLEVVVLGLLGYSIFLSVSQMYKVCFQRKLPFCEC